MGCDPTAGAAWKFKVFRYNTGTTLYDMVSESALVIPNGIEQAYTVDLVTPLAVQMGDVPGVFIPASNKIVTEVTAPPINFRYEAGDITTSHAFSQAAARSLELDLFGYSPFLVVTGDSVPEGHNGATSWHGPLHAVNPGTGSLPGGTVTSEIANQIRGLIGDGKLLEYQNLSLGSQTFAWVAATGIIAAHAALPNKIFILCGVNDVSTARIWADVETDLNTIKTTLTTDKLYISEILPWTAGSDAQAATIRTWNAALAAWCAANSATLIVCHDAMGQIRVSTGEIDDLLAAYDQDGVHLSTAGVAALAGLWKNYI